MGLALLACALVVALALLGERGLPLSPEEVERHLELAESFERNGDEERASQEYERCLRAARRTDAPLLVSRATNRLAALEQKRGRVDRARALSEEALAAADEAGNDGERAAALFNLGSVQYSLGRMREAIGFFGQAAESASKAADPEVEARAELQTGVAATMMENRERATVALERAIALSRERGDASGEAQAVRVLGELHSRLGETDEALEEYARAREILRPIGDVATEATLSNAMGQVYFDMDDKETALRYYEEALRLNLGLGVHRRIAATRLEIGRCYLELGRDDDALSSLMEALTAFREIRNQRLEADALTQLGRIYARRGDGAAALRSFAEAIALKTADTDPRERADTLREAARFHASRGQRDKARSYLREAFELSGKANDPAGESLALYRIAELERDHGDLDEARKQIERSIEIVESLRAKVASHALRTSFFASVHDRYSFYVDVLLRLDRLHPEEGFDALAFTAAERGRARTLLDSLGEARASIREGIEPGLLEQERTLRRRLNEAASERLLLAADADPETKSALAREVDSLSEEYDRLQATIRTRSPRYAALTQPRAVTLAEVETSILDEDTRLLSYTLGRERSYLWSVTRQGSRVYQLPSRDEIETLARKVRNDLKAPAALPAIAEGGAGVSAIEELSRALLGPVDELRDGRRLAVVADGALGMVPFGALLAPSTDGTEPTPLVTLSEIVRLPSITVLPELRAASHGRRFTRWAAVAADPVYDESDPRVGRHPTAAGPTSAPRARAFRLRRLPASGKEALALRGAAPPDSVELVTGFKASRGWVTSTDFRTFRVVHFATHGILDDDRPELSGIVLSLVDERGNPEEGFLRLDDVYNLSLPVGLVVLSACETGLGKEVRGEGLLSIVRGFMYAGAVSVIASSWKVDDQATAELMARFYPALFAGKTPAASLREAQISMLATRRFRDPFYWAGFEIQGDWKWDADARPRDGNVSGHP